MYEKKNLWRNGDIVCHLLTVWPWASSGNTLGYCFLKSNKKRVKSTSGIGCQNFNNYYKSSVNVFILLLDNAFLGSSEKSKRHFFSPFNVKYCESKLDDKLEQCLFQSCLCQFWFSQGICLGVGLLGHMVVLFLVFKGISIPSSIVAVSIYIPTKSARLFHFLYTLSSIYHL